jgi:indole-3-glycerol phosphate synthase
MILDEIVRRRRDDVARAKRVASLAELEQSPGYRAERHPFAAALKKVRPAIIAEVKKASPSRSILRDDFDPVDIARSYSEAGATALSVLTEEHFFRGHLDHLLAIRRAVELPLLRKDFLIDPYQVAEARAYGADCVLLIMAILEPPLLAELLAAATALRLDALVEVHESSELDQALERGATLIGINNRNLHTFETDLGVAERLRPLLPTTVTAVAESGINCRADIDRLRAAGFEAFLIGESLMRSPDPGAKLRELLGAVG